MAARDPGAEKPTAPNISRPCRLVLWVVRVWRSLIEVHGVEQEGIRNYEYTGLFPSTA